MPEMKTVSEGVGDAPNNEPIEPETPSGGNSNILIIAILVALAVCIAIGFGVGYGVDWDDDDDNITTNVTTEVILTMEGVTSATAASKMSQVLAAVKQAVVVPVTATCRQFCMGSECFDCDGTPVAALNAFARTASTLSTPIDIYLMVVGMISTTEVLQKVRDNSYVFQTVLGGKLLAVNNNPSTSTKEHMLSFGTSMTWGPDGRMYVVNAFGEVAALQYNSSLDVTSSEVVKNLGQQLTGITLHPGSTASNIVLYVSGFGYATTHNTGGVWKLNGTGSNFDSMVAISGLPRSTGSIRHGVSGIHFGADNILYISSGGLTASGAPVENDTKFSTTEVPLSTAILTADVDNENFNGVCYDDTAEPDAEPNCTLGIHATGFRNVFDFAIHSNGKMYANDNGHQKEDGGAIPTSGTAPCGGFGDPDSNPDDQQDILLNVKQGKYYGHPNPTRDECTYYDGSKQGVATPANFVPAMANLGMRASANGITEYASTKCASLHKNLIFVRYATGDDVMMAQLSADGESVVKITRLFSGGLVDPLAISEKDGNIFVTTFSKIVAFKLVC